MLKLITKVVSVNGRRTSMSLCKKEWNAFDEICQKEKISRNQMLGLIETSKKPSFGLTYSTRLVILSYFQNLANVDKCQYYAMNQI